jgi:hypothetical protein
MQRTMKTTAIMAALIGAALVTPLLYLELRNAGYTHFPYPLFAVLWLVPAAFVFTAARPFRAHPVVLSARVGFLILAALFWAGLVNDQMPCFLGVPNCD